MFVFQWHYVSWLIDSDGRDRNELYSGTYMLTIGILGISMAMKLRDVYFQRGIMVTYKKKSGSLSNR